ncbi:hypothetical protein M378DRAFT_77505 [Amanita muscaria Koide BX008]|uniref:Uncharacterized protein n=1 Tax=Amanita muscaria (strain Koide BX008) TaxID=946122 RepID=A0A0C2SP02_AMAMK|nr:hypothetical protein M378DRAFT_77505 [Amanita muscaria Koide BX008]
MVFQTQFASVLRVFADSLLFLSSTKIHDIWYPYTLAATLHAARISVVYQHNVRKAGHAKSLSWPTYLAGYLVMCWAGNLLSHLLIGLPPPTFYSVHPYINYISTHLFFTALFNNYPELLIDARILDTLLFPLDALLKTNAITASIGLVTTSAGVNPLYANSPLTHMLLGAIASAGGALTAATFKTWTPEWSFGTPPVLKQGVGVWGTLDVWGGALVSLIYGVATSHPAFSTFTDSLGFAPGTIVLSPLGAKALGAVVLTFLYGSRVFFVHWTNRPEQARIAKVKAN